ncbi:MAG: zinc ribbon domain-containing protein [Actinomycetes bacterium]
MPEHAQLAGLYGERDRLASDLVAADTEVSDLELDQARAEADLEPVQQRLARDQQRIADGSISDPRALSAMTEEVEHLRRRISDLEDAELTVMQALEDATVRQSQLRAALAELGDQIEAAEQKRDASLREIAAAVAERTSARAEVAAGLPPDLLVVYAKIAAGHGGVGAAELAARRCTGCRLEVNAADLRRFAAAPADEVLRCEECSRILVRTENSGI